MTPDPAAPVGLDLDALKELLARATPGPWVTRTYREGPPPPAGGPYFAWIGTEPPMASAVADTYAADAALIVAAVNALPALLDLVSRQQGVLERALYALEIAKYRLDGVMNYPGEPNSITASLEELRSLLPREPK